MAFVEFHYASRFSVDMAIMYLYGKCPKPSQTNIHELLDLAEFLMIPNLKALCVKVAQCFRVHTWDVKYLLQMATLYEFDLPRATEHMYSHLDDLMEDNSLMQVSKDFIEEVFVDETLRYVSMDTRLNFLIRWTEYNISRRKRFFPELFALLDNTQLSRAIIQTVPTCLFDLGLTPSLSLSNRSKKREVIIFQPKLGNQQSDWYDICNDQWLKPPVSFKASTSSVMSCFTQHTCYGVCFSSKIEIADVARTIYRSVELYNTDQNNFVNVCANATKVFSYSRSRFFIPYYTVFYQGTFRKTSSRVLMEPAFTVKTFGKITICLNEANVCAIILPGKIILFDTRSFELDTLPFYGTKHFKVLPLGDGFVIHDNATVMFIQRVSGPNLDCRYTFRETYLTQDNYCSFKYRLVGDVWFRQLNKEHDVVLERSVERFNIRMSTDLETLTWKQCTLPSTVSRDMLSSKTIVLALTVPTYTVRCHINCPHCEAHVKEEENYQNDIFYENINNFTWESDVEPEDEQSRSYDEVDDYTDSDYSYDYGFDDYYDSDPHPDYNHSYDGDIYFNDD
ncbi:uncharacterized protein LOC127844901 isoform X2 [Dreissena polymorpha]|uniref:uncharacterized protein LOC127844901 isoform X2 n=1 Tax=Dreissena polymorpha TaxID=45954 RepID=UPI002264E70C|nr:uncharacterized protein LOC127844901 isoform X2 [Dreissena polymorpha]